MNKILTRTEEVVLKTADFYTPSYDYLAPFAASFSSNFDGGSVSEDQAKKCLDDFLEQGILRIMSEQAIKNLREKLIAQACHGPIFGFPKVGRIDFTEEGAALFREKFQTKRILDGGISHVVESRREYLLSSFDAAMRALSLCKQLKLTPVSGPLEFGPWQLMPWSIFENGYLIEVVDHYPTLLSGNHGLTEMSDAKTDIAGVFFREAIQRLATTDGDSSYSRIVCLAASSGLFGKFGGGKRGLCHLLGHYAPKECKTNQDAEKVIEALLENGELLVATESYINNFKTATSRGVPCVAHSPTLNHTVILNSKGIRWLRTQFDQLSGEAGWHEFMLGKRSSKQLRMSYFGSKFKAIEERDRCLRTKSHFAGEIEEIGRWCKSWWDIRETGYRFRQYDNF
ncbi:hypothetical protein N9Y42_05655 [Mariniblastus sp.]|nr:hypothetical protein [Mariniblastus sp.]